MSELITRNEQRNNRIIERINRSLESYDGKTLGDRDDDTSWHVHVVDVEFQNMALACEWAQAAGMLAEVTVDKPKPGLNVPVVLTFAVEAFLLAVLEA